MAVNESSGETGGALDVLLTDAAVGPMRRWFPGRAGVEVAADALSPSNFPLTNPAVLKAVVDTGGRNFVRGAGRFVRDMSSPPRVPSMISPSAFTVGEDLAVTPGEVVLRTRIFELLQYKPQTDKVREHPLLITPPMINKYYVTDRAPGRSMVEHVVRDGQQTFAISWRNPGEQHAEWGLDAYARSVIDALEAVEAITGSESTQVLGLCDGGIVLWCAVAHLAATGQQGQGHEPLTPAPGSYVLEH